jgi:hypothetical protein
MIADERRKVTAREESRGDYKVQRDWLNPDRQSFGQVTSRTRRRRLYDHHPGRLTQFTPTVASTSVRCRSCDLSPPIGTGRPVLLDAISEDGSDRLQGGEGGDDWGVV